MIAVVLYGAARPDRSPGGGKTASRMPARPSLPLAPRFMLNYDRGAFSRPKGGRVKHYPRPPANSRCCGSSGMPARGRLIFQTSRYGDAEECNKPRRAVFKIDRHLCALFPRTGFIVTGSSLEAHAVITAYNFYRGNFMLFKIPRSAGGFSGKHPALTCG